LELFIRDQITEASRQFFLLQTQDTNLTADDVIDSVEIQSIAINNTNNIVIALMFYPRNGTSVQYSIQV
jgi:hypothetical protein